MLNFTLKGSIIKKCLVVSIFKGIDNLVYSYTLKRI